MKKILKVSIALLAMAVPGGANAAGGYNSPGDDKVYAICVAKALRTYEGAEGRSAVSGQTRAEAWCTCMWNETPDDFSGDLVDFAESPRGKKTNEMCEKHAGW